MKRVRYRCAQCRALTWMNKHDSVVYRHAMNAIGGDGSMPYGNEYCIRCVGMTIAEVRTIAREGY